MQLLVRLASSMIAGKAVGELCACLLETGSTSLEAHCREAALISCLGLGQFQNNDVKLKNFGLLTLCILFMKFVIKRPPVIRASDVPFHVGTCKCSKTIVCEFCGNILQ